MRPTSIQCAPLALSEAKRNVRPITRNAGYGARFFIVIMHKKCTSILAVIT